MVGVFGGFGGGGLPAMLIYQTLTNSREKQLDQLKQDPRIVKEIEYLRERVAEIETVDEFINDRRLMSFALSAFALEDEINLLGRIRKILTEPRADPKALVNKLIDPRFKELAAGFEFAEVGLAKVKNAVFLNDLIDRFYTNEFERRLGQQNPALREAEFFRRKIGEIENTFDILGDRVFRAVVTFTLGLPLEIALQSVDKQKSLIEARVDIEKFKDPKFVDDFIRRFLLKKDSEAGLAGFGAAGTNAHLLPLFQGLGSFSLFA